MGVVVIWILFFFVRNEHFKITIFFSYKQNSLLHPVFLADKLRSFVVFLVDYYLPLSRHILWTRTLPHRRHWIIDNFFSNGVSWMQNQNTPGTRHEYEITWYVYKYIDREFVMCSAERRRPDATRIFNRLIRERGETINLVWYLQPSRPAASMYSVLRQNTYVRTYRQLDARLEKMVVCESVMNCDV